MKLLLDTNGYVGFKTGHIEISQFLLEATQVLISPVVLGELIFGFRNGTKLKQNMDELNEFITHEAVEVIPIGEVTADRYARISERLKQQGTPIPTNDIWIAAQTMEHGAELVTMDRHFTNISGLVYHLFP